MDEPIPDRTEIRLTSEITVRLVQAMGGDHMVVAAAKVSTSGAEALALAAPDSAGASAGLIRYLMRHRHGTPFEHAALTFFVHAPAFVWWEWVRHRIGFSYNLESSRYKPLDPVFWIPRPTRPYLKPDDFRPARPTGFLVADPEEHEENVSAMRNVYRIAFGIYEDMLADGVVGEVARAVLPFAIYFSGWVTCNPRSLMAFLSLRTRDPDAEIVSYPQAEIEEAARICEDLLAEGWPLTYRAFLANGRVAP